MANETSVIPEDVELVYLTLGLNGEAGEVADKLKKYFRGDYIKKIDDDDTKQEVSELLLKWDIAYELGDVLWYVAMLAKYFDLTLEEIAIRNVNKLQDRAARDKLKGNGDNR